MSGASLAASSASSSVAVPPSPNKPPAKRVWPRTADALAANHEALKAGVGGQTPAPPALVTMATDAPAGNGWGP
ncbi:hypothetical protein OHA61_35490 [Streptomyces sp. NBC_00885]|uniref:hypothetical protein n=1 Tax=Streptomyces sp. NBC_00885 TaxID=2975857 RepID=UPI003865ABA3|nr:hypothetical protein OHA61_35490 [Streptomyces sp. NBC_00885]